MPKYDNINNVPAKVFFDILRTKDYQLLKPKPKEKELEAVFIKIYDDFFLATDNDEAKSFLNLRNEVAFLDNKIKVIKSTLLFLWNNQTTKEIRVSWVNALNEGCGLDIDFEKNWNDEVQRILQFNVGWLKNDLNFAIAELENIIGSKKNKEVGYWTRLVNMSRSAPPNLTIRDNMFLAEFVEVEKALIEYNKSLKQK